MANAKFVKPAGNQLNGPTSMISGSIQRMPANGKLLVGVFSADDKGKLKVGPNDPSAAFIEDVGSDSPANVRWFQLTSKRAGNVMVEIRSPEGSVLDYFQLAMKDTPPIKLPAASGPMEFEFEADTPGKPGQINMKVYTPRNEPDYVDTCLNAVGWGIYLFGAHLYCGLSLPVLLPDAYIDFTVGNAVSIDSTIYPDRAAAEAAILAAPARTDGVTRFAYYRGAGGALVVPTIFSPATTPRTIQTLLTARALLAQEVQNELVVMALTMVGGMVLKSIATRLVRVGSKSSEPVKPPPAAEPPPLRIKPAMQRLQNTTQNLQSQNVIRTSEVLEAPRTFRHTLTGDVPAVNYAQIEKGSPLRLSKGEKAQYGEGVYAWLPGQQRIGVYIDIEVPAGTGVETLNVNGQRWVRMVPPEGNALPVKIVGTNMPEHQIEMGRALARSRSAD
ncbi:MAG: hypothetical protein H7Y20_10090 [Bryobacteraceae bacterium]|nr:hypothetical protein [Bryobacteraceae bacterium]